MQIDSVKLHELLNQIALDCNEHDLHTAIDCMKAVRKVLCDLEADTACSNAKTKYAGALSGLADK